MEYHSKHAIWRVRIIKRIIAIPGRHNTQCSTTRQLIAGISPGFADAVRRNEEEGTVSRIDRAVMVTRLNASLIKAVIQQAEASEETPELREAYVEGAIFLAAAILRADSEPSLEALYNAPTINEPIGINPVNSETYNNPTAM